MIDFYADTKTKPTRKMLEAVLTAEVGDEQKFEDPTTLELCRRTAELLGKEDAVFLPSGSMCNEIAINVHTNPGDEMICDRSCHIVNYETGAPAALSSVMINSLDGERGFFTPEQVKAAIRPSSRYMPISKLLCVEQTANLSGGSVWPLKQINEVALVAKEAGMVTHMDGARLMNAVVQSGISASEWSKEYDSVWIDFTKGLGAPVGAVLAGSKEFIEKAWRVKQQIGGAMRQSGVIASMCLYALDNNVERLAEDHDLAANIGKQLSNARGVKEIQPIDTNIIMADLLPDGPTAADIVALMKADNIQVGAFAERRVRIVTHLDVNQDDADIMCERMHHHLNETFGKLV
ncbi:MAG: threonine aldolase family protein [Emcibacteraceae bacterium]|nr:threonine aldolase family protein [Emcibacteraceae bacterium]